MTSHIVLLGAGAMGGALLQAWVSQRLPYRFSVVEPDAAKRAALPQGVEGLPLATQLPEPPAAFVIATKPQVLPNVLPGLKKFAGASLFISIAAGRPISFFENILEKETAIVRAMPNLPAMIGKGITVAVANEHVDETQAEIATSLLSASGELRWTDDEGLLDPVTAVSGSGPAYVFHLVEVMTEAGVKQGLPADLAYSLAKHTVIGGAALLQYDARPASDLRTAVTSPGGTTAAALAVLQPRMAELFDEAIKAASIRAKELSEA